MGASCYKSTKEEDTVREEAPAAAEYSNETFAPLFHCTKRDRQRIVGGAPTSLYSWDGEPIPGAYNTYMGKNKKTNKQVVVTVLDFESKITQAQIDALLAMAAFKPRSALCVPSLSHAFFEAKQLTLVSETEGGHAGFQAIANMDKKQPYTEADAISGVIFSVASAMNDLHQQGLVQGDIQGLLLRNTPGGHAGSLAAQVPTYNLSRLAPPARQVEHKGACPPEVLLQDKAKPAVQLNAQTDAWNLGVLLHMMLVGYPPLQETEADAKIQMEKMKDGEKFPIAEHYWSDISEHARDLVTDLLTVDTAKRITVAQVLDDPWIGGRVASTVNLEETRIKFVDSLQ